MRQSITYLVKANKPAAIELLLHDQKHAVDVALGVFVVRLLGLVWALETNDAHGLDAVQEGDTANLESRVLQGGRASIVYILLDMPAEAGRCKLMDTVEGDFIFTLLPVEQPFSWDRRVMIGDCCAASSGEADTVHFEPLSVLMRLHSSHVFDCLIAETPTLARR